MQRIQADDVISLALLLAGAIVAGGALVALLRADWRRPAAAAHDALLGADLSHRHRRWATLIVVGLVLGYLTIGLLQIERWGMTHVEAYVPGLTMPDELSAPPPRHGLGETFAWHWHSEPHPVGYFMFMWGWNESFGSTLTVIRLPSLLFGAIAIVGVYLIAARVTGSVWPGVIAAALLAFNGHHLYWSLMARPYEAATMLGVLSTWLLLALLDGRRSTWLTWLYVLVLVAGLYVQIHFWIFLAAHLLYATLIRSPGQRLTSDLVYRQTLAMVLASPAVFHAIYTGRKVRSGGLPTPGFTQDYLNFGFLYQYDQYIPREPILWVEILTTAIALAALTLFFVRRAPQRSASQDETEPPSTALLAMLAAGLTAIGLALYRECWRPSLAVLATVLFPFACVAGYLVLHRLRAPRRWPTAYFRRLSPVPVLAFGTLLGTYALSILLPAAVSRGLLIAVPPLLVCLAIGLYHLGRSAPVAALVAGALTLGGHAYSLVYYADHDRVTDYRGLAEQLVAELRDGDLIFVRDGDWVTTPIFYHLAEHHSRLVGQAYAERAAEADRIWAVQFDRPALLPEVAAALTNHERVRSLSALRGRVHLYLRKRSQASEPIGSQGGSTVGSSSNAANSSSLR